MDDKAINAAVGEVIRQHREHLGVTQGALGGVVGVRRSQVQKYENGISPVPPASILKLADYFGIPVARFYAAVDAGSAAEAKIGEMWRRIPARERTRLSSVIAAAARKGKRG